ncbi:MAG TPA: type II CAAX endopeptidase family protein [Candidatus Saccharimonadales bacterium]|jgi:membrane protease YdiL (CAAX protease family)
MKPKDFRRIRMPSAQQMRQTMRDRFTAPLLREDLSDKATKSAVQAAPFKVAPNASETEAVAAATNTTRKKPVKPFKVGQKAPKKLEVATPTALTATDVSPTDIVDNSKLKKSITPPTNITQGTNSTGYTGQHYGRNLWLFVWIIVVIAASQLALFVNPLIGVYVNAAVFANLTWLAVRQERARQFYIVIAIIPLTMLVSLSLPEMTVFVRTTVLVVILLALGLIYQYLFTLDYPTDGSRMRMTRHGYLFAIPFMLILGQFIGLLGYALLRNQYDFRDSSLLLVALGAIVFAIAEEIFFRGLIQQRAMLLLHPILAAVLSAGLYAGMSFGHRGGMFTPVLGAILGIVLAAVYYKKQNVLLTISVNAAAKLTYIGLVAVFVLQ